MSTGIGDDQPAWPEVEPPFEDLPLPEGLRRPDSGPGLDQTTTDDLTLDVEVRLAPAGAFPPADDDETTIEVRKALEETLGPDFEKHLAEVEPRMLEWLSDPERALAFAIDPVDALARLDPPLDRELVEALRKAASMIEPPPRTGPKVRVRLTGAGVERG
jgi:hypothetical protein